MEKSINTQIIEFNGLAGCGKTTLTRALKDELIKRGYRVVLFGEAYRIFKEHPVGNIIRCLKMPLFLKYIKLFLVIGRRKENTWRTYWQAIRINLIYRWCLETEEFDFILTDHGLVQNIISLLGFSELKNYEKFKECLSSILKAESSIYVMNCNVSIEQSMQRIRIRNKNTGRLDRISDDLELEMLLQITENNFYTVRNLVKATQKEWPISDIDTEIPVEVNLQRILNLLACRKKLE